MRRFAQLAGLVAALIVIPSALRAEQPTAGTVSGTGAVEIRRQPDTLRVYVEVLARGKTPREAVEKLKARRDDVRAGLENLGADKARIAFGDASLVDPAADQNARVERMIRERNGALGRPKPAGPAAAAIVSAVVRADFPLPAGGPDEFLVASRELQDKVKAADLGGLKERGKLTPEEEEAAEEALGPQGGGRNGEPDRGEPVFVYVGKVTEEERAKALAGAFVKAKRDAERLAKAAGADLGGLTRLTHPQPSFPGADFDGPYGPDRQAYFMALQLARSVDGNRDDDAPEAVGSQPGKVTLRVGVTAEFGLKLPAGK